MKKKHKKQRTEGSPGGYTHISSSSEFYSSSPSERPLSDSDAPSDSHSVRETVRHQAALRGPEKMDPREKMALMAILKSAVLILSLVIAFFLLWKGINLYEESVWLEHADAPEKSPVLLEVELGEGFDIQDQNSREQFAERIEFWKEADRLVRSADALLQHNNQDQAIELCQDALRLDPAHIGALERLARLYYAKGNHVEAINAYIRLLSVDPSRKKIQKRLIAALNAYGDHDAVKYTAEWYLEENAYDVDVQRYLANALYAREDFAAAAEAFGKVLRELPRNVQVLEQQASSFMQVQQYEKALVPLSTLRRHNNKNPVYHKQIAVCQAQLQQGYETVQTLGRAAQVFGVQIILGFIQDPQFDPVREERAFQAFVDRVGGKEFRLGIEDMARRAAASEEERTGIEPQLEMPVSEFQNEELLKPKK
ncbi:MAG: hypothetical protein DRP64_12910 [Verrucomicrobia bacterium]|nr:MAG: hypothetical protein DRP64_12910 [Verrucomicrobiota bacterium]